MNPYRVLEKSEHYGLIHDATMHWVKELQTVFIRAVDRKGEIFKVCVCRGIKIPQRWLFYFWIYHKIKNGSTIRIDSSKNYLWLLAYTLFNYICFSFLNDVLISRHRSQKQTHSFGWKIPKISLTSGSLQHEAGTRLFHWRNTLRGPHQRSGVHQSGGEKRCCRTTNND